MKFHFRYLALSIAIPLFLVGCQHPHPNNDYSHFPFLSAKDTVVGHHVISTELPGGGHLKRAELFYLVIRRDTSAFRFKVLESFSERVTLDIRFTGKMTYREQLAELKKIIPFAVDYFNIRPDFFQMVFVSRLMTMGDLAIDITKEYDKKFPGDQTLSHHKMNSLLLHSKLTKDWNAVLRQVDMQVDTVFSETMNFGDKKYFYESTKMETDSSSAPAKLLDCLIWLRLKPKRIYSS